MIFLFPLGIPACYLFVLARHRQQIKSPDRDYDVLIHKSSFLWENYEPQLWWWEVFECCRRLALSGLLVADQVPDSDHDGSPHSPPQQTPTAGGGREAPARAKCKWTKKWDTDYQVHYYEYEDGTSTWDKPPPEEYWEGLEAACKFGLGPS